MDEISCSLIVERWRETLRAVAQMGGRADELVVEPPASVEEVAAVEQALRVALPASLKDVLLTFSRKVVFRWDLPKDCKLPGELCDISGGDCHWSLEWLVQFNKAKARSIEIAFSDPDEPYNAVWRDKLAFHEVGNGDFLAIELREGRAPEVVYLSHDYGIAHGHRFGADFRDFLLRWSRLACVGPSEWQLLAFGDGPNGYLNTDGEAAESFRRLIKASL